MAEQERDTSSELQQAVGIIILHMMLSGWNVDEGCWLDVGPLTMTTPNGPMELGEWRIDIKRTVKPADWEQ